MRVGICGYPGSGKSTVFTVLAGDTWTQKGVTYGRIQVPDQRVDRLAKIFSPKKTSFAEIVFMDAGGGGRADTGAFPPEVVQNMRNADVLAHVVRGFQNPLPPDPAGDARRFEEELVLLDLTVLERRLERFRKEARKDTAAQVTERAHAHLEGGQPLRTLGLTEDEVATFRDVQLLSDKPLIALLNLSEDHWHDAAWAGQRETKETGTQALSMAICGAIEAEIAELPREERAAFLEGLGLGEPARNEFVRAAYRLLDLISFLTAGPDECRAWPIRRGTVARKAAGKVHSDIERGFIRAEIYRLEDLEAAGTEQALKATGKLRLEGKEYQVADGDVVNYRFNV
jgi:GTP-binding protein YchF